MLHTSMEVPRKRPLGVSILAALEGLQGGAFLIVALLAVIATISNPGVITVEGYTFTAPMMGAVAGGFMIAGILSFLFAWGLWRLQRWAFWATVIIQALNLVNSVIMLTQVGANVGIIAGNMIVPIVILLYFLIDSNVRAAFRT